MKVKRVKVKVWKVWKIHVPDRRREVIAVAASSKMLAPVEHKVKVISKDFGFKNPLREHEDEAEKFVIISLWIWCLCFTPLSDVPFTGACFPGYCSTGVGDVYNQDLNDQPANILWPHGCYVSGTWIFHASQTFNFTRLTLISPHDLRL